MSWAQLGVLVGAIAGGCATILTLVFMLVGSAATERAQVAEALRVLQVESAEARRALQAEFAAEMRSYREEAVADRAEAAADRRAFRASMEEFQREMRRLAERQAGAENAVAARGG